MANCENCTCKNSPGVCSQKKVDDIQVCESKTCGPKHSKQIMDELQKHLGVKEGECNDKVCLNYRGCLGYCEDANNMTVNGNVLSDVIPSAVVARVEEALKLPEGDNTKGEFKELHLEDDLYLGI